MAVNLRPHQLEALSRMKDGCILCGGVGSGKSRTALAYYFCSEGGEITNGNIKIDVVPKDLYIITTAQKRDKLEWEGELVNFLMYENEDVLSAWGNKIIVDSWNNLHKYSDVTDSFFIFDEQRLIGNGVWVKVFWKIAKHNRWILLSATPGDKWEDYIPVFVANGFYRNRTEFLRMHAVFNRFSKFPKIDRYLGVTTLIQQRNSILVDMPVEKTAVSHHESILVEHDRIAVKEFLKTRWDPYKNQPIQNAAEFSYVFRKIVNSDPSRILKTLEIVEEKKRVIIFYN